MEYQNRVIFVDKSGNHKTLTVPDYCKVTLLIQDGKVVSAERNEKIKLTQLLTGTTRGTATHAYMGEVLARR